MFQYAIAVALSGKTGIPFKIDVSDFKTYRLHKGFQLDAFDLSLNIAEQSEIEAIAGYQCKSIARRLRLNRIRISKRYLYECNSTCVLESLSRLGDIYLDGYWQSDKFFFGQELVIRNQFKFRNELFSPNLWKKLDRIVGTRSVSIHVRRGDYTSRVINRIKYHQIKPCYFKKASDRLAEQYEDLKFFVFSDDPQWARSNILSDGKHNVEYQTFDDCFSPSEEMFLMSNCNHNIVTNSTFGWWGAWLNKNPTKMVTTPGKWYRFRSATVFPENWIIIK